jgi:hypothetical protein
LAIEAPAGPAGSSADSGPVQPGSIASTPNWTVRRKRLRYASER